MKTNEKDMRAEMGSVGEAIAAGLLLAAFAVFSIAATVQAGEVRVPGFGAYFRVNVESIKEARFRNLVPQRFDFSCGSAATATLLTYHYGIDASEASVFQAMYEVGDQDRIRQVGFSLLDMKLYLESVGLRADGFRLDLDRLEKAGVPAIVLINTFGYRHFVVLKGVSNDEVLLGDPALGVRVLTREAFDEIWDGIAFVIRDKVATGRQAFNRKQDWTVRVKAPLGNALSHTSLSNFTVQLWRGANSF